MYDSREKAILDYKSNLIDVRKEGREEGRIQLLQELLGEPALSTQELNDLSLVELQNIAKSLQSKLRDRNA